MSVTIEGYEDWAPEAKARLRWLLQARPNQLTPPGDWLVWTIVTGRGWGKTRTGAEDVAEFGRSHPRSRIAVVAPTFSDGRDVCIEGESGLLNVVPPEFIKAYNRSMGEVVLMNGSQYQVYTAEKPNRLRGPQHHRAWCDEFAAWKYLQETWDMLMFGLRLGEHPQVVITTTPRPRPLLREIMSRSSTMVTTGTTYDNIDNLARVTVDELQRVYADTALGRQELEGVLLEDVEGALWSRETLEASRIQDDDLPALSRVIVAVDPAVTSGRNAAETGIVVVGKTRDCPLCNGGEHAFVLEDRSGRSSPDAWGRKVVAAYKEFACDRIIGETNNGGELVAHVLRTVDPTVPFKSVHASRGKRARAEPIAALYEQGKVHHVGFFDDLEQQMCTWDPEITDVSPDRVDALVWGLTELMITNAGVGVRVPVGGARQSSYWKKV